MIGYWMVSFFTNTVNNYTLIEKKLSISKWSLKNNIDQSIFKQDIVCVLWAKTINDFQHYNLK